MDLPGLSFGTGLNVQKHIWDDLGLPISNPALGRDSFFLVVAFRRCKFRLSCDSVGLILQATIGGVASDFRVFQLDDRVFHFVVAAKSVGLFVRNLNSFECKLYKLFFFLWGNGGPNWRNELRLFLLEEEQSWDSARSSSKVKKSFADAVKSKPLTGANAVPMGRRSVHTRIRYPDAPDARTSRLTSPATESEKNGRAHERANLSSNLNLNFCSRSLSKTHLRSRYNQPIRCHACMDWGHIC